MRYLMVLIFFIFFNALVAQPGSESDQIYQVVEEMPRFPGCEEIEGTKEEKEACSKEKLLTFINGSIVYPDSAISNNIVGTVVVRFVVTKEGEIVNATLLKDIGGGCGEEALRAIKLMNDLPEQWMPGKKDGKAVDVYYTVPVKFKITQPNYDPDFVYVDGDTIWVKFDEFANFRGGEEAYQAYSAKHLEYPFIGNIDCAFGAMEIKILVRGDGSVKVMDITDYNNLGLHFWYEAVDFIHKSSGKWEPATFQGRNVNTTFSARIEFLPTYKCETIIENFKKASDDVDEGIKFFEEDQIDQSIAKFNAAVELFPEYSEFLAFRGQAFLEANRLDEACADLTKVRELLYVSWYDHILPSICKKAVVEDEVEGADGNQ